MKHLSRVMAVLAALCWGSLGAALSAELGDNPRVDIGRSATAETGAAICAASHGVADGVSLHAAFRV